MPSLSLKRKMSLLLLHPSAAAECSTISEASSSPSSFFRINHHTMPPFATSKTQLVGSLRKKSAAPEQGRVAAAQINRWPTFCRFNSCALPVPPSLSSFFVLFAHLVPSLCEHGRPGQDSCSFLVSPLIDEVTRRRAHGSEGLLLKSDDSLPGRGSEVTIGKISRRGERISTNIVTITPKTASCRCWLSMVPHRSTRTSKATHAPLPFLS